jgi:hypothetical protein
LYLAAGLLSGEGAPSWGAGGGVDFAALNLIAKSGGMSDPVNIVILDVAVEKEWAPQRDMHGNLAFKGNALRSGADEHFPQVEWLPIGILGSVSRWLDWRILSTHLFQSRGSMLSLKSLTFADRRSGNIQIHAVIIAELELGKMGFSAPIFPKLPERPRPRQFPKAAL